MRWPSVSRAAGVHFEEEAAEVESFQDAISGTSTTIDRVTHASVATSGRKEYKSSKGDSAMNSGIHKVGVIGIGLMGSGIAQVAAAKGFDTVVVDVTPE